MTTENGEAHHIEPAEGTDGLVNHRHDLFLFGDIASNSDGTLPGRLNPLHQRVELLALRGKVTNHDVEAVLGKAESNSLPDTLGCTSDDGGAFRRRHPEVLRLRKALGCVQDSIAHCGLLYVSGPLHYVCRTGERLVHPDQVPGTTLLLFRGMPCLWENIEDRGTDSARLARGRVRRASLEEALFL